MIKMSRRSQHTVLQEIRRWSTKHLQKFLTDHGLDECCEAIRKRDVDGEAFLALTEGQLALWKRDLNLATIRKLANFVQDVNAQPEKYAYSNIVGHSKLSAVNVSCGVTCTGNKQWVSSVSGKSSPVSDSWDTDFSDDDTCKLQAVSEAYTVAAEVDTEEVYCNSENLESEGTYSNSEVLKDEELYCNSEFLEKSPVLVQSPEPATILASTALANTNNYNLPKPPVPSESIKTLVNTLLLPENNDQFDEEDYESLDKELPASNRDALAALLKKSLEDRAQAGSNKRPVPTAQPNKQMENIPPQSRTLVETAQHVPTFPQQTNSVHVVEGHVNDGYDSEEYESINEKPAQLPPGDGTEYYLQPVQQHKQQDTGGAPPLPAKTWQKPADATFPSTKPPSPPRSKLDDIPNSPGSLGDSGTGLIGKISRKFWSPGTIRPQDSRERTPTPEVKKPTTFSPPSHKPMLVDLRQNTFQSTQRPLPPTPGDNKFPEKPSAIVSHRISQQPWYHSVDRRHAEELLRNGEDGSFLVRPSTQNPMTLTLWYKSRPYNIGIRHRSDGRYALGTEKSNEQSFASVEELIQNYQSEKLVLYSGGEKAGRTLLTTSPPQGYQGSV